MLPASTFKIVSALAALDADIIGVDDVLSWDGVVRDNPDWDQDQRMRDAFQRSTVWFFQALVRRIGGERMQALLRREDYGNAVYPLNVTSAADSFQMVPARNGIVRAILREAGALPPERPPQEQPTPACDRPGAGDEEISCPADGLALI